MCDKGSSTSMAFKTGKITIKWKHLLIKCLTIAYWKKSLKGQGPNFQIFFTWFLVCFHKLFYRLLCSTECPSWTWNVNSKLTSMQQFPLQMCVRCFGMCCYGNDYKLEAEDFQFRSSPVSMNLNEKWCKIHCYCFHLNRTVLLINHNLVFEEKLVKVDFTIFLGNDFCILLPQSVTLQT